mmetsp:Transcript_116704/g.362608  ORF Transcript_116704/g.362608 Transcript_116704/m.362608 type:complete len:207 (+) Transcript_116704:1356-1976(+)
MPKAPKSMEYFSSTSHSRSFSWKTAKCLAALVTCPGSLAESVLLPASRSSAPAREPASAAPPVCRARRLKPGTRNIVATPWCSKASLDSAWAAAWISATSSSAGRRTKVVSSSFWQLVAMFVARRAQSTQSTMYSRELPTQSMYAVTTNCADPSGTEPSIQHSAIMPKMSVAMMTQLFCFWTAAPARSRMSSRNISASLRRTCWHW